MASEDMAEQVDDEGILGALDIYTKTAADIPEGAKRIVSVRNRPYAYIGFGIGALALFFALVPQYRIGLGIAIVLCIVVAFFIDNHPVLDIYDGFIVCYKGDDPERICIIPAEHLIYWSVASGNTSVVQVFFEDMDDSEQALCANVHTINSYQASNALDRYFHEKSYAEIKRQADLRKLGRSRKK